MSTTGRGASFNKEVQALRNEDPSNCLSRQGLLVSPESSVQLPIKPGSLFGAVTPPMTSLYSILNIHNFCPFAFIIPSNN